MLNMTKILSIAFFRVFKEQVDDIKKSYSEEPWINLLISYAEKSIRDAEAVIYLPGLTSEDFEDLTAWHNPTNEEFYTLTCVVKDKFAPVDFLFFKAFFAEGEEETVFLLQQAQMMEPENLRLHILAYFMSSDFDEDPDLILRHLDSLPAYRRFPAVNNYIFILKLIRGLEQKNVLVDADEIVEFLNGEGLPPIVRFSILYLIMESAEVTFTKRILDNLNIYKQEKNSIYKLVNAWVFTELKEYDTALYWFRKIKLEDGMLPLEIRLRFLYRLCCVQMNSGNEGKAILMLREIVYSGIYDRCGCDEYYHAVVDLASSYMESGQREEAGKVLSILNPMTIEILEEMRGEEFLLLMAENHMLQDHWEEALVWYRKAFKISGDKEVANKIKLMEKGLYR